MVKHPAIPQIFGSRFHKCWARLEHRTSVEINGKPLLFAREQLIYSLKVRLTVPSGKECQKGSVA
jgi:hypothetical protein